MKAQFYGLYIPKSPRPPTHPAYMSRTNKSCFYFTYASRIDASLKDSIYLRSFFCSVVL